MLFQCLFCFSVCVCVRECMSVYMCVCVCLCRIIRGLWPQGIRRLRIIKSRVGRAEGAPGEGPSVPGACIDQDGSPVTHAVKTARWSETSAGDSTHTHTHKPDESCWSVSTVRALENSPASLKKRPADKKRSEEELSGVKRTQLTAACYVFSFAHICRVFSPLSLSPLLLDLMD